MQTKSNHATFTEKARAFAFLAQCQAVLADDLAEGMRRRVADVARGAKVKSRRQRGRGRV